MAKKDGEYKPKVSVRDDACWMLTARMLIAGEEKRRLVGFLVVSLSTESFCSSSTAVWHPGCLSYNVWVLMDSMTP